MPILIVSRDPGGSRQMVGVHAVLTGAAPDLTGDPGLALLRHRLSAGGDALRVVARDFAGAVWASAGITAETWPDGGPDLDLVTAVLTSTSDLDDDTPQSMWQKARTAGLPSHAFIDCALNVRARFVDRSGATVLPDFVYVSDTACFRQLDNLVAPERVALIPDLVVWASRRDLERAAPGASKLRHRWQGDTDRRIVLFVSENVAELAALGKPVEYSEFACLEALLSAVRGQDRIDGIDGIGETTVVIRPHPKEVLGKFARYETAEGPYVLESREGSPAEAILAADLVVGMRSTLLREARDAGRPVVSLVDQPARRDGI